MRKGLLLVKLGMAKFTFMRTVNQRLWNQWLELIQISTSIHLTDDKDLIIWQFNSSGRYSVQSLYVVVFNHYRKKTFVPQLFYIPRSRCS
jgi:hypothetical protein